MLVSFEEASEASARTQACNPLAAFKRYMLYNLEDNFGWDTVRYQKP
jgi:hypothetical protein